MSDVDLDTIRRENGLHFSTIPTCLGTDTGEAPLLEAEPLALSIQVED